MTDLNSSEDLMADISIRRYEPADIEAVYQAVIESRNELSRWMPWCHANYSRADTEGWVNSRAAAWDQNEEWSFLIVDTADRVLGGCGIHRFEPRNGVAELGYWVRSNETGRGIATAATRLLCEWGIRERSLHRIEILASIENLTSRRVAEKAGGVCEGILRERLSLHGRWHDCALYAILKTA